MPRRAEVQWHPATVERWSDLEKLFGERGACGGCWCMVWRLSRAEFDKQKGDRNRQALRQLVESGPPPGILAYVAGRAVGWCAVAPRSAYSYLERTRVLKPIDNLPVWSVSCLFVEKGYRRRGLSVQLLKAAVEFVRQQGGEIVEGYPVEPKKNPMPDVFAWTGTVSAFRRAGFKEVGRGSPTRPIMRVTIRRR